MSDVQDPVGGDDTLAPPAPLAGAASALDRPFTAAAEGVDADARDAVPDGPSADTTTIAALPGSSAGEPSAPVAGVEAPAEGASPPGEHGKPSRRPMIVLLSILAACVLIAAGVWAVTGWITRDTIVVPDTLGGMAKTTTPLLKVLVTGEADQLHQQLGSDVHSLGAVYGDPTRFALLTVFQNPGGSTESDGSIEDIMAAIISSAGVQDFGNGATMSFGPISAVGDASCAVGTVHANGQSKDAAVLCGRLKGDVAVLVESAPPDTATGAAMVDEAMAAQ